MLAQILSVSQLLVLFFWQYVSPFHVLPIMLVPLILYQVFSVVKATIQLQMSVCQSEIKTPQPLKIKPICHYTYLLISQMLLSAIMPISYHPNLPPCPPPLGYSLIIPICISHHHAYWPLYLLAICPAFATSKPFRLVSSSTL